MLGFGVRVSFPVSVQVKVKVSVRTRGLVHWVRVKARFTLSDVFIPELGLGLV